MPSDSGHAACGMFNTFWIRASVSPLLDSGFFPVMPIAAKRAMRTSVGIVVRAMVQYRRTFTFQSAYSNIIPNPTETYPRMWISLSPFFNRHALDERRAFARHSALLLHRQLPLSDEKMQERLTRLTVDHSTMMDAPTGPHRPTTAWPKLKLSAAHLHHTRFL